MPKVISFHYTLTDKSGAVIDSSEGRGAFAFMEGAGQIIPGLERQILALKPGDKKRVEVAAKEAYGERQEQHVIKVQKSQLPPDVKKGDRLSGGPGGPVFLVMEVGEAEATLDGNHALAGKDLTFDVEIAAVREATAEEQAHGHAHGEHGHSH